MFLEQLRIKNRYPRLLAVVGASARSAAFSAIRTGHKVVAADLFADADLTQHCPVTRISQYPEQLVDWLAATECDAWFYTGALENYPDLVDRLAQAKPLLGNRGEVLRRCRDPLVLQTVLGENDLYFPETRTSKTGLPRDGSWLCKTYRGSNGTGVWELCDADAQLQADVSKAYFQQRVEGRLMAVVYAIGPNWTATLGITAQLVGASSTASFQYSGSTALRQELESVVLQQLERLASVLAMNFQLRGLVGVDFLVADDRVWILEINPRYTASVEIVERNYHVSAIDAHLAAFSETTYQATSRQELQRQMYGKAILYAKQDTLIDADFFAWAIEQSGLGMESTLADIPTAGSKILRGRPILTVFASTTRAGDNNSLQRRLAEVEARLYGGEER